MKECLARIFQTLYDVVGRRRGEDCKNTKCVAIHGFRKVIAHFVPNIIKGRKGGKKKMKLSLRNIGKIDDASVEIEGITVIAGENNTGKSTVGRVLFSIFYGFCDIEGQIKRERVQSVGNVLDRMYGHATNGRANMVYAPKIAQGLVEKKDLVKNDIELIKSEIVKLGIQEDRKFKTYMDSADMDVDGNILRIKELLNVSDNEISQSILERKLEAEFNGQTRNIYSKELGEIRLQIKDAEIVVFIDENNVTKIESGASLHTEAIYLDDPFVLDEIYYPLLGDEYMQNPTNTNHRVYLENRLVRDKEETNIVEEIVVNKKFENIYNKISMVCDGDIIRDGKGKLGYEKKRSGTFLNVRNTSAGLKMFMILKMLLQKGILEYNGTVILDEPEIHLHPEWQLLFAELIVLLHKEFHMHVLLNTHSPYFLRALQVYAAKYEVADKCRYYLAEEAGDYAHISDVTDNIEKIYSKLSRPLQKLEDERWQDG